ncbi:MAG TPA: hypothetical protein VHY22_03100 [Chthoniobacteraceae bacterium]|jgi:hypothetical protein|nr:hypothetical protein [Chthoniobacteraceae bacterium]
MVTRPPAVLPGGRTGRASDNTEQFAPAHSRTLVVYNRETANTLTAMALGTKNRQQQSAEACKQHLREKHRDNLGLVNEFITEIEGAGKDHDLTKWGRFADASWKTDTMLARLDEEFEKWLRG